jgi:hypothetical protein
MSLRPNTFFLFVRNSAVSPPYSKTCFQNGRQVRHIRQKYELSAENSHLFLSTLVKLGRQKGRKKSTGMPFQPVFHVLGVFQTSYQHSIDGIVFNK